MYLLIGLIFDGVCLFSAKGFSHIAEDFVYLAANILALAFSFSVGCLFCVHTYIIATNMSTIEMYALEKENPFKLHPKDEYGVELSRLERFK